MRRTCRRLQRTLAEHGPAALRGDEAAQRHLEDCDACFAALESLAELDAAFEALPAVDAPDEVVARLLARDELAATAEASPIPQRAPWRQTLDDALRQLFGPGQMRLKASVALALLAILSVPFFLALQRTSDSVVDNYANVNVVAAGTITTDINAWLQLGFVTNRAALDRRVDDRRAVGKTLDQAPEGKSATVHA